MVTRLFILKGFTGAEAFNKYFDKANFMIHFDTKLRFTF